MGFVCRFSLALALGVGHKRSSSVRFPPLDLVPEQARGVGQIVTLADGKDEEPLALVGRADFRRREEACRKAVAHADQSCGDFGKAEAEMMGDILEEDEGRLDFVDDAGDMRPEMTRVVRAPALARDGERLARIARSDDVQLNHSDQLDARGSVIYRGKPRFSVFGVGAYTYAPWKVAISGFYKSLNFMKVAPLGDKPVVMDDTIYFLPCQSEEEADFVMSLVQSEPYMELVGAMIFLDEKRPITADLLKRISLEKVAGALGLSDQYAAFTGRSVPPQLQLALG